MSAAIYRMACRLGRPIVTRAVRCHVQGLEHLPAGRGFLLAANHESYFDAMLISGLCPYPIRWLSGVSRVVPMVRPVLRSLNVIPIGAGGGDAPAVRLAVATMAAGGLVAMFPEEGIRVAGETMLEGGRVSGRVFKLARLAKVPLVPCAVAGSGAFAHWRSWLPGSGRACAVVFAPPLDPGEAGVSESFVHSIRSAHDRARACIHARIPPVSPRT